jgi:hypothetical protein
LYERTVEKAAGFSLCLTSVNHPKKLVMTVKSTGRDNSWPYALEMNSAMCFNLLSYVRFVFFTTREAMRAPAAEEAVDRRVSMEQTERKGRGRLKEEERRLNLMITVQLTQLVLFDSPVNLTV